MTSVLRDSKLADPAPAIGDAHSPSLPPPIQNVAQKNIVQTVIVGVVIPPAATRPPTGDKLASKPEELTINYCGDQRPEEIVRPGGKIAAPMTKEWDAWLKRNPDAPVHDICEAAFELKRRHYGNYDPDTAKMLFELSKAEEHRDNRMQTECPQLDALGKKLIRREINTETYLKDCTTISETERQKSEQISAEFERISKTIGAKYGQARNNVTVDLADVDELGKNKLVCRDTAAVMAYLLKRAGVPNTYVTGEVSFGSESPGPHAYLVLPEQRVVLETTAKTIDGGWNPIDSIAIYDRLQKPKEMKAGTARYTVSNTVEIVPVPNAANRYPVTWGPSDSSFDRGVLSTTEPLYPLFYQSLIDQGQYVLRPTGQTSNGKIAFEKTPYLMPAQNSEHPKFAALPAKKAD